MKRVFKSFICIAGLSMGLSALLFTGQLESRIDEYNNKITDSKQSLEEIKQQITEIEHKQKEYNAQKKHLETELKKTGKGLTVEEDKLQRLSVEIDASKRRRQQLREKLRSAGLLKQYFVNRLSDEINGYYVDYLASSNPGAMDYVRLHYRKERIDSEVHVIENAFKEFVTTRKTVDKVSRYQKQLKEKYETHSKKKNQLEQKKSRQSEDTYTLLTKKKKAEKELKDLQVSASSLQALISQLYEKKEETEKMKRESADVRKNMVKSKGNLPWPMTGSVISPFGRIKHPDLDTYIYNNGIRIKSTGDSGVHAVAKGKVVFAGNFGSFGNMIIIDHRGGFFTVYGHLENITVEKNNKVERYDILGNVNDSNKVLYFEIRKKEQPQNPIVWLKRRKM